MISGGGLDMEMGTEEKKKTRKRGCLLPPALPNDVMTEIFGRLPVKSLMRFSCVCKEWRHILTTPETKKKLPRAMAGILCIHKYHFLKSTYIPIHENPNSSPFRVCQNPNSSAIRNSSHTSLINHFHDIIYNSSSVSNPTDGDAGLLAFSPLLDQSWKALDCCNGLLLCSYQANVTTDAQTDSMYVCDPATRRWAKIPSPTYKHSKYTDHLIVLAFDPEFSDHYYTILILPRDVWGLYETFNFQKYSSKTGKWEQVRYSGGKLHRFHRAIYHSGVVYVADFRRLILVGIDLDGKAWDLLELPLPPESCSGGDEHKSLLGKYEGCLRYGRITTDGLYVWNLEEDGWVLKHKVDLRVVVGEITRLLGDETSSGSAAFFSFVAFHPDVDVVFLKNDDVLFSYRLIGRAGEDGVSEIHARVVVSTSAFDSSAFFVYTPIYLDHDIVL